MASKELKYTFIDLPMSVNLNELVPQFLELYNTVSVQLTNYPVPHYCVRLEGSVFTECKCNEAESE